MAPYARHTGTAWFFLPTLGYVEYEDGERAFALVWLQLEICDPQSCAIWAPLPFSRGQASGDTGRAVDVV